MKTEAANSVDLQKNNIVAANSRRPTEYEDKINSFTYIDFETGQQDGLAVCFRKRFVFVRSRAGNFWEIQERRAAPAAPPPRPKKA